MRTLLVSRKKRTVSLSLSGMSLCTQSRASPRNTHYQRGRMEHEQRPHGWARTEDALGYASPSLNYQDQGMDTMRPGGGELGQNTAPTVVPELGGYERPSPLASMPMVELQAQAGPRMNDAEAQYELARRLENAPGHGPLSMVEKVC